VKYHLPAALVAGNEQTGEDTFLLSIISPEIAREAQPGQFVHIRTLGASDPLLRRPVSICQADRELGTIRLWYQVVGKGTNFLSRHQNGDTLDLIGPLGKGFDTGIRGKKTALIGGGVGIAPLLFLARELAKNNSVTAFFGGKQAGLLPPPSLLPAVPCHIATEDGSLGHKGLVTELLPAWIEREKPDILYSCGPRGMLLEVVRLARRYGTPLQVSLEAVMACGVGACLGCTCEKSAAGEDGWLKACQDGPVFWDREVRWE